MLLCEYLYKSVVIIGRELAPSAFCSVCSYKMITEFVRFRVCSVERSNSQNVIVWDVFDCSISNQSNNNVIVCSCYFCKFSVNTRIINHPFICSPCHHQSRETIHRLTLQSGAFRLIMLLPQIYLCSLPVGIYL